MARQLSKAFLPRVLVAKGSAPASRRTFTTDKKPTEQAVIKGVAPLAFRTSKSARFSTNSRAMPVRSLAESRALQTKLEADRPVGVGRGCSRSSHYKNTMPTLLLDRSKLLNFDDRQIVS